MTTLTKPVSRVIHPDSPEPLVVTLALVGIQFRIKGTRTTYTLPYSVGLLRAAALHAEAQLDAKAEARRGRRASRSLLRKSA